MLVFKLLYIQFYIKSNAVSNYASGTTDCTQTNSPYRGPAQTWIYSKCFFCEWFARRQTNLCQTFPYSVLHLTNVSVSAVVVANLRVSGQDGGLQMCDEADHPSWGSGRLQKLVGLRVRKSQDCDWSCQNFNILESECSSVLCHIFFIELFLFPSNLVDIVQNSNPAYEISSFDQIGIKFV